ncbi:Putative Zn-dependent protease, contains TPR repeats [Actinomyces slackii]|uniref:Zn-dependent protease, contains TPR repeats n=3 Tax=Actinomyces slackii TaxID=52774 RepID=A0A3S4SRP6_9ACTO|nr:Putative Zn-dependent protease, contains TPR repeats [Actinomyces slackii]
MLIVAAVLAALIYLTWIVLLVWLSQGPAVEPGTMPAKIHELVTGTTGMELLAILPVLPFFVWVGRAMLYARARANAVQMSPTQFPEGYRMVVEAAQSFGLRRVPDAYVALGNGSINAFASGHGFRRFVTINSDLFEVGGSARDPEALRFIIGHEVGHIAAGHTSYLRSFLSQILVYIPVLGQAFSRAQEYTADNHGFATAPKGAAATMAVLAGGKYLGAQVNAHALAERAVREKGLWVHLAAWGASHPLLTWRMHALRDRSAPGRLMIRPRDTAAWFPPFQPSGHELSAIWPTPAQVLAHMDACRPQVQAEEQFGRYPGVEYSTPRDTLRWASPVPVPRGPAALASPAASEPTSTTGYGYTPGGHMVSFSQSGATPTGGTTPPSGLRQHGEPSSPSRAEQPAPSPDCAPQAADQAADQADPAAPAPPAQDGEQEGRQG